MRGVFHTIATTASNPFGLRRTPALSRALESTATNSGYGLWSLIQELPEKVEKSRKSTR
jgi:hypothetical protein